MIKGYKVFNSDYSCRDYSYLQNEKFEGTVHEVPGEPILCKNGFHFCEKLIDCFNYYPFDSENKVAEIEVLGELKKDDDKSVTNKIKIVKELTWFEVLELVNTGKNNTGKANSGDRNSGNGNSGNGNSGYRNSGNRNSGDGNSGDRNSGDRNSGDNNTGNRNSGSWNSGHGNSGDNNTGNRNSGSWNGGYRNSGDCNSGNCNSGNWNSGDWNIGGWNSCNNETGFFNSVKPKTINVFNKPCKLEDWKNAKKPNFIYFDLNYVENEEIKTKDYKTAFKEAWKNASKEDREKLFKLPNFDKKVFLEISGIDVDEKDN